MLDDRSITTAYKVIGGQSTARLRLDFDINFNGCASFKLLAVDCPSLTFRKKLSRTDNRLTRPTTVQQ